VVLLVDHLLDGLVSLVLFVGVAVIAALLRLNQLGQEILELELIVLVEVEL